MNSLVLAFQWFQWRPSVWIYKYNGFTACLAGLACLACCLPPSGCPLAYLPSAHDAFKQDANKQLQSSAWPSEARPNARSAAQSAARSAARHRRRRWPLLREAQPPPKAASAEGAPELREGFRVKLEANILEAEKQQQSQTRIHAFPGSSAPPAQVSSPLW